MSTEVLELARPADIQDPLTLDAGFGQLNLFDAAPAAEQVVKPQLNGTLVQHYPRDIEGRTHVQLGRQFREEGVEIDWPESSFKLRAYLQTTTGDKFMIVGNTFYDLGASEKAGEAVYCQLDPDAALPSDLVGKTLEYLPGQATGTIEMVEISAGYSDSQGEHLDAYENGGADPFEKFNRRLEQIPAEYEQAETERLVNDGVLLTDFRTYPEAEPRGLRARARRAVANTGLAGKALMAEVRGQARTGKHEWKYTRRKAALAAVIGAVAFGGGMAVENGLSDVPLGHGEPAKALTAAAPAAANPKPETVIPRSGDNPWEIAVSQLVKHGDAHPSGSEIASYDRSFLKRNFPRANDPEQAAKNIQPGKKYLLPSLRFKKSRR